MLRGGLLLAPIAIALVLAAPTATADAASRSFFGVAPQREPSGAELAKMARKNVGTVRVGVFWSDIDPSPSAGDYRWSRLDAIALAAARHRLRLLPFIFYTPDWVARELDGRECATSCFASAPASDLALQAWRRFVSDLAARYGPDGTLWRQHPEVDPMPIRTWEIWNEQNNPDFFAPQPNARTYARLLESAADALREQDPGSRVLVGGMFHPTPQDGVARTWSAYRFLGRLYKLGAADAFDGVAAHPYAPRIKGVRAQLNGLRRVIRRNGDAAAELWVTEIGWSSARSDHPLAVGRRGQASRLRALFRYARRHRERLNLSGVILYSWRNTSYAARICEWCPKSGLLTSSGRAKPALRQFSRLARRG